MARTRQWRRWRADVEFARARLRQKRLWRTSAWLPDHYRLSFTKRNSISETVTVQVTSRGMFECWIDHRARLQRDNAKSCSCWICGNPRNSGIGNSAAALTRKEGSALMASIYDIASDDDVRPPNSKWRKRKWRSRW